MRAEERRVRDLEVLGAVGRDEVLGVLPVERRVLEVELPALLDRDPLVAVRVVVDAARDERALDGGDRDVLGGHLHRRRELRLRDAELRRGRERERLERTKDGAVRERRRARARRHSEAERAVLELDALEVDPSARAHDETRPALAGDPRVGARRTRVQRSCDEERRACRARDGRAGRDLDVRARGDGHGPGQDEPILPDVGAADLTHPRVGGVTSGRSAAGRRARRESSQRDPEQYMTKHERPSSKPVANEPGPHASRFAAAARRHVHPR